MVCLITTGDAAGVAQVGKWRLGPQSFAAALTVTRRFPVVADDLRAAVGSLALRGENDLYGVIEQGLWSLLGAVASSGGHAGRQRNPAKRATLPSWLGFHRAM
jgi:hypothetical protein